MRFLLTFLIVLIYYPVFGQKKDSAVKISADYSYQYALIEASRQKMIGNVNEAISLYQTCINANDKCDVAHYELGTVYSALGENDKAEHNLEIAYKLNPDNYWYGIAYSELLKQNKKESKSLKILKKTRKLNKSNRLTIDFKIAEIYSDEKKYRKAISFLEEIEEENGVSEMVSFKKVEIYKLQKDFNKAENVLLDLSGKAPEIVEYQIILAEFYSEIGDSAAALLTYEKAFRMDSSNIYAISNLADIYSSRGEEDKSYFYLNHAFQNKNIPVESKIETMMLLNKDRDLIKSKRFFIEKMIKGLLLEYPDNDKVKSVAYDFYNGLEEHEKALTLIKEILVNRKEDFIVWQQALYNASMLENYEELILIGEEALKYFPNKNEFYLFVGMAYFQKKEMEAAYSVLSKAVKSIKEGDRIKIQFLLFLSEVCYQTNRKTEAYSYFDQLIIEDPTNDFTKNNYSYYLAIDSVDLQKAKQISYSTIVNSPGNATFIDTYAWILYQLLDYKTAREYAEKALLLNAETDPDILFHYAEILFALKDFSLSKRYYELALERGYDKKIINEKISRFLEE